MPDFFYQIKARQESENEWSRWIWPPVFSGKVTAADKKAARAAVDEEYGQKFPMRVLAKDIATANFLLKIDQIEDDHGRTHDLFQTKSCKMCGAGFRIIDHYNNAKQKYAGRDFCSDDCRDDWKKEHDARLFSDAQGASSHPPVIYKIENIATAMAYVGQTCQPFTLRWWQHFFHGTNTKFHQAIRDSKMTDWRFCILEVIDMDAKPDDQAASDYIHRREQFWIDQLGSIANGYNTATAKLIHTAPLLEGVE